MQNIVMTQLSITELKELFRNELEEVLAKHQQTQNDQAQKTVMNFTEGCTYAGISKSHGYKLTSKGLIPHSKRGKKIYFEKSKLDNWLLENKISTVEEMNEELQNHLIKKGGKK